ncbi:uncharacterized protein BP5553_01067 [Venustampulla echinocandica]|uniref:tRNA(Phe) 7-[(3-amino-3-carboxypropyl)-4-demethylwyosine(37)-N(4)]-methyltransferase n=1 Tax=Venustampulla echinocandica TaxID=2656787 RepID=A0A370TZZ2_9HELO|nr:uncharacterized protein BP5553_01067 [Venustampulla echinocandica]RDL41088.1 hypothetical protein BP5553_01067 [Venustampulla echinocandica]
MPSNPSITALPQSFISKKKKILEQLAVPSDEYGDLSPKGSIDEGIRDLIDEINRIDGCVTTSSCAGRVSVFLEGSRTVSNTEQDGLLDASRIEASSKSAGVGGKGGGGRWLFVSHDPVDIQSLTPQWSEMLGMHREQTGAVDSLLQGNSHDARFIHFKFEPMILHVLTASLEQAQHVLAAALQAGFRESGALNLTSSTESPTPMVGIRSMGLALESLIGFESGGQGICIVPEWQLKALLEISNDRFVENTKRTERFRSLLKETGSVKQETRRKGKDGDEWEDPQARRERKRAEGLKISEAAKQTGSLDTTSQTPKHVLNRNDRPQ